MTFAKFYEAQRKRSGSAVAATLKQDVFSAPPVIPSVEDRVPVRIGQDGGWILANILMRLSGASLILCAPALFLLPGAGHDPALLLYKLGAAIFFMFCGAALLMRNRIGGQSEIYFDAIRREMRILQKNDRGRPQTVLRRSYESLGGAKLHARQLEIWDVDGSILLNVPLANADARDAVRNQLGDLIAA